MSGYSRTDRRCSDTSPKITSIMLRTVAKTGRRTDSSEMRMLSARAAVRLFDRAAVADVLRAVDDDALVLVHAVDDLDVARLALAGLHLAALDGVVAHDEHVCLAALGDESLLGHEQRGRDFALQRNRHEHALAQQA